MNKYRLFADSDSSGFSVSNIFYAESYVDAWRRSLEYISVFMAMKFIGPKEVWTPIMPKDLRIKLTEISPDKDVEEPDTVKEKETKVPAVKKDKSDLNILEVKPCTFIVAIFKTEPIGIEVGDLILYTDVNLACSKDVHTINCATAAREAVKYFNSLDFCEVPSNYSYGVFTEVKVNDCMRRLRVEYIDTITQPVNFERGVSDEI